MVVVVCGGRRFRDVELARSWIDGAGFTKNDVLVHGGAPGADTLIDNLARERGIHTAKVLAIWSSYGKKAGPQRNAAMMALKPDEVVAFPGGKGTQSCMGWAEFKGIPVRRVGW